jgi:hypothetical protein
MSVGVMPDGATDCRPNISRAGIRRRIAIGGVGSALTALLMASLVAARARWFWSVTVFVPAFVAAIGFLQAGRKTCVARAAEGTFEHDDFSKTPAPEGDVVRSREVAAGIMRHSVLIGVAVVVVTIVAVHLR